MGPPLKAGPLLAPDKISIWPVEGERFGIDGTYQGAGGFERAESQRRRLTAVNVSASVRQELGESWILRVGPLTRAAAWTAIEAFLGPRVPSRGRPSP
jgi:hypothetical protein